MAPSCQRLVKRIYCKPIEFQQSVPVSAYSIIGVVSYEFSVKLLYGIRRFAVHILPQPFFYRLFLCLQLLLACTVNNPVLARSRYSVDEREPKKIKAFCFTVLAVLFRKFCSFLPIVQVRILQGVL